MVESELKGDLEWAMLLRLKNPVEAKAWLLHFAMEGMGTSEDIIAVSRFSLLPLYTLSAGCGCGLSCSCIPVSSHARELASLKRLGSK